MSVRLARWLTALSFVGVFIACAIPGHDLPEVDIINVDKLVHVAMFAVLGWFLLHALGTDVRGRVAWTLVLGAAYGGLIEVYQATMPIGRSGDVIDGVADAIGILLAVLLFQVMHQRRVPISNHTGSP